MVTLPKGVGPHEGIEFDLLRQGRKKLAYFVEIEPEGLVSIIAEGFHLLHWKFCEHDERPVFAWIVYDSAFQAEALRLKHLVSSHHKGFNPQTEREIGTLLSYSDTEINAYLLHVGSSDPKAL